MPQRLNSPYSVSFRTTWLPNRAREFGSSREHGSAVRLSPTLPFPTSGEAREDEPLFAWTTAPAATAAARSADPTRTPRLRGGGPTGTVAPSAVPAIGLIGTVIPEITSNCTLAARRVGRTSGWWASRSDSSGSSAPARVVGQRSPAIARRCWACGSWLGGPHGEWPSTAANRVAPRENTSAAGPPGVPLATSGAM
nr:hypothetical protein [Actinokineospora spheciospongiae]